MKIDFMFMFIIQYEFRCHEFQAMHLLLRHFFHGHGCIEIDDIDSATKNNNLK